MNSTTPWQAVASAWSSILWAVVLFSIVGLAAWARDRATRSAAACLGATGVFGLVLCAVGEPAGSATFAIGVAVGAAVGFGAAVRRVSAIRSAYASIAGGCIVVFGLAAPAVAVEQAVLTMESRPRFGANLWALAATDVLPSGSLVIVPSTRRALRIAAMRATATFPTDVEALSVAGLSDEGLPDETARVPLLWPVASEMHTAGMPTEVGLTRLAEARPLFLFPKAGWGRDLARHSQPFGLWERFSAEPVSPSDRRLSELRFAPLVHRMEQLVRTDSREGLSVVEDVLEARLVGVAAASDREGQSRVKEALERLRRPAPPNVLFAGSRPPAPSSEPASAIVETGTR